MVIMIGVKDLDSVCREINIERGLRYICVRSKEFGGEGVET